MIITSMIGYWNRCSIHVADLRGLDILESTICILKLFSCLMIFFRPLFVFFQT